MMTKLEAQRLRVSEVTRESESHLRAVMPATRGIDAFVFGILQLVIPILPLLKE